MTRLFLFILCSFNLMFTNISCLSVKLDDEFYSITHSNFDQIFDNLIVKPIKLFKRNRPKRSVQNNNQNNTAINNIVDRVLSVPNKLIIEVDDWIFVLEKNEHFSFGKDFQEVWVNEQSEDKNNSNNLSCQFYTGTVLYESDSQAIVTICEEKYYYGFFTSHGRSFVIEPIEEPVQSHIVNTVKLKRNNVIINNKKQEKPTKEDTNKHDTQYKNIRKRDAEETSNVFDLTGDTILDDVRYNFTDEDAKIIEEKNDADKNLVDEDNLSSSYDDYDYFESRLFIKEHKKKSKHKIEEEEDLGYFVDTQWQTRPYTKVTSKYGGSHKKSKTERWLEIALAVDYTVIEFHGKTKIKQYIMSLMNIVSAIYKDASLDANLHLVMARLIFYSEKKDSVIKPGNAKKSLEDVNRWNYRLIGRLGYGEKPHDVAVWLTREYLGGPSGYAPVAGVCDRSRSTALNKDEGLASAFIIAHEMAHILGLTHDGDMRAGNKCDNEVLDGTIMAPTVTANFHRFTWSTCSKEEFHRLVKQWHCLLNPPEDKNHKIITPGTTESFTMDEQCRMEYGEGYGLCRNFELIEPCTYLWCGQKDSIQCITKKGAPAEGTQCGFDKWCVDGYCQSVDGRLYGTGFPRAGGWGQWSEWSKCSRPCGYGVRLRRRSCDNPTPAWGGAECEGSIEEKEICQQVRQCWETPTSDPKADRCNVLSKDGRRNETWLPYETEDDDYLSCRVSCMLWETGEVVRSTEYLPDGTSCTYDNLHDICIDGRCKKHGCDGVENSTASEDNCGVCEGNGDSCFESHLLFNRSQKKNLTRLLVLPRHSRNIKLQVKLHSSQDHNKIVPYSLFHLTLRNRNKKLFKLDSRNSNDVLFDALKQSYNSMSPVWSGYQIGIVLAGSVFTAKRPSGMLTLSTKGPLHYDIVVMLNSPQEHLYSIEITVEANYTLGKQDVGRYKWILEENMPCQCGVVPRPAPIYCVDTRRGNRTVHGSHCSRAVRPRARPQSCNLRCDFHWIPGPWEACTAACGKNGTSHRQLYCVPLSLGPETPILRLIKFMVEPKYCKEKPASEQPCNIFPCPAYWEEGPWSKCSSVCGPGVSTRPLSCDSPDVEDCGDRPTIRWRSCRTKCMTKQKPDLANCHEDRSPYCTLNSLSRYCVIPTYRKLCCQTCKDIQNDFRENFV